MTDHPLNHLVNIQIYLRKMLRLDNFVLKNKMADHPPNHCLTFTDLYKQFFQVFYVIISIFIYLYISIIALLTGGKKDDLESLSKEFHFAAELKQHVLDFNTENRI